MSKICRIVSTCLIAAGLCFLYFYIYTQNVNDKFAVLERPSYYILQNYWYIFVAGVVVLVFSLFGSFLSWFKGMEEKEEILPNAGYSSSKDITAWVGGSSLDTEQITEKSFVGNEDDRTEIIMEEDRTEVIEDEDKTEMIVEEDKTEVIIVNTQEDVK